MRVAPVSPLWRTVKRLLLFLVIAGLESVLTTTDMLVPAVVRRATADPAVTFVAIVDPL